MAHKMLFTFPLRYCSTVFTLIRSQTTEKTKQTNGQTHRDKTTRVERERIINDR